MYFFRPPFPNFSAIFRSISTLLELRGHKTHTAASRRIRAHCRRRGGFSWGDSCSVSVVLSRHECSMFPCTDHPQISLSFATGSLRNVTSSAREWTTVLRHSLWWVEKHRRTRWIVTRERTLGVESVKGGAMSS